MGWTVKFLPKEKANVFTLKVRQENELLLCPGPGNKGMLILLWSSSQLLKSRINGFLKGR